MKAKNAKKAAPLIDALAELPRIKRALTDKPGKYHDSVWLSLTAAEMSGGQEQGANHWCSVPVATGRKIVATAMKIIKADLRELGIK